MSWYTRWRWIIYNSCEAECTLRIHIIQLYVTCNCSAFWQQRQQPRIFNIFSFYFFFFNIYWHHLSLSACGFVYMSWKWNDTQQSSPLTSTLHTSSKWLVSDNFFSFNLCPSIYSFSIYIFIFIYIHSERRKMPRLLSLKVTIHLYFIFLMYNFFISL